MVEFKTWRDYYIFLKDFSNFTCLNCYYGGSDVDLSEDQDDSNYAFLFCKENFSMVRLDMMSLCGNWKHENTGKSLEEYGDSPLFDLTDEQIDILNNREEKWSIDEIRELCDEQKIDE